MAAPSEGAAAKNSLTVEQDQNGALGEKRNGQGSVRHHLNRTDTPTFAEREQEIQGRILNTAEENAALEKEVLELEAQAGFRPSGREPKRDRRATGATRESDRTRNESTRRHRDARRTWPTSADSDRRRELAWTGARSLKGRSVKVKSVLRIGCVSSTQDMPMKTYAMSVLDAVQAQVRTLERCMGRFLIYWGSCAGGIFSREDRARLFCTAMEQEDVKPRRNDSKSYVESIRTSI
ncbi:hypothetical protein QBC34DRAFT_424710 [Podospora aff. communis PSN243]|uniref:Uncharacterized protein n=1 Tax=Podospora aff. communis PSN243 TaxID=3040156 RepID=A0AAV9GPM6_9PEZI|nr:hypothetical protein QBC34DRAFT_424710 [Podospora aff. communis PSN243]